MSLRAIINTNEHLPDGTPLVRSHTITGTILKDGEPYPNVFIQIIEPDIDDVGEGYSDDMGRFVIQVGEDTFHHVWVDRQDIQGVKVLTK
jgi:hypothetical protein